MLKSTPILAIPCHPRPLRQETRSLSFLERGTHETGDLIHFAFAVT